MAQIILHTSHTVFVKQAQDMGASLATINGELFAVPQLLGVNIITGKNMRQALAQITDYEEGDVIISNDPYATAGMVTHLPDLFVWKPLFVDGELLCFAGAFVHSSDVGGKVPGSISPTNTDIFQEGLRLPPLKLYRAGVLNEDIRTILFANCRIPEQNWGDISAMLAALDVGERRMRDLIKRYGADVVRVGISGVLDYAERQARALIHDIPDGHYVFWDYMEGDQFGWPPIRIKLSMTVRGDEIWCDFTGTEMQVRGALNLPSFNMPGHYMLTIAFVNLFRTLNRNLPSNAGVVRPIHTYSPPGTLLNPEFPAAVGVRGATMYRVIDVAMATLGMARPDVLPAAGAGMSAIILLAARDPSSGSLRVSVMQPLSGGGGGRTGMDGTNGTNTQGGWMRNIPNETLEAEMPVLIRGYGLRGDSSGAGEFRGGWGLEFTFSVLAPSTTVTARGMDRYNFPPWGRDGGNHGTTADTLVMKRDEPAPRSIG
jgi:N-methylhydantoinase B